MVLAQEKPNEPVYKFYSPTRSCTQTHSTPSPHAAPVTARNAPVWARSHLVGVVYSPSQIPTQIPLFSGIFLFYHKGIYLDWIFLYR